MFFWTAFTIGLLGSMHCVGMCAPIAMALPYGRSGTGSKWVSILQYNTGRLITYSLIGLLFGLLGKGLFLADLQQAVSILMGVGLLLVAVLSLNIEGYLLSHSGISRLYFFFKQSLGRLLRRPGTSSLLTIGILNGFLPCGLVYMALVGALSTGSALDGMLYMALFGLGTFPLMMLAGVSGQLLSIRLRRGFRRMYPVFLVAFALLLLLRGFQFDLPKGIQFWESLQQQQPMCH